MSSARKTLESAVITALWKTAQFHRLTIDKCNELVPAVVDELFSKPTRWAVSEYLKEVKVGK